MSKPFTVTVDARVVFDEERRGIAKTVIALYRTLATVRPAWRFRLVFKEGVHANPFADLPNIIAAPITIPGDRFDLWSRVRLPFDNGVNRPHIFHAPAGPAPWNAFARQVVTIHDLIPLETGRTDPPALAWIANLRRAARRSRMLLTASQHAKERIVHCFGVDPAKIEIIHWGPIQPAAKPLTPECQQDLRTRYAIPAQTPYVLHFGMADPRKNTAKLIEAWSQLAGELRSRFTLVIIGVAAKSQEMFRTQIQQRGITESVRLHGYASEEDVAQLLAGAVALAYPTQYEGFGLPILDAFAAGVPVLCGNATSLPEVAGDAAVLVDPTSASSIATGLDYLLKDEEVRRRLIQRGRERLNQFNWQTTAERVATLFEAVARS